MCPVGTRPRKIVRRAPPRGFALGRALSCADVGVCRRLCRRYRLGDVICGLWARVNRRNSLWCLLLVRDWFGFGIMTGVFFAGRFQWIGVGYRVDVPMSCADLCWFSPICFRAPFLVNRPRVVGGVLAWFHFVVVMVVASLDLLLQGLITWPFFYD